MAKITKKYVIAIIFNSIMINLHKFYFGKKIFIVNKQKNDKKYKKLLYTPYIIIYKKNENKQDTTKT